MNNIVNNLSSLLDMGFKAEVQSVQRFNVICVSKYSFDNKKVGFHFPPTGLRFTEETPEVVEIEVKKMLYTRGDISVTETVVAYQGKDYLFKGISNGLSGSALCVGIYNNEEDGYDLWWLYTDTHSANPDRPDEVVTSEELRDRAQKEIGRNGQYNR